MKDAVLILMTLFLFNCSSDDDGSKEGEVELLGKWKLIEQLLDPGDGSGTFKPVSSERTIEFFNNGIVSVNGDLCYMNTEVGDNSTGTFVEINDADVSNDGAISSNECSSSEIKIYYDLSENGNLILWYPCIEACGQKFEKVN